MKIPEKLLEILTKDYLCPFCKEKLISELNANSNSNNKCKCVYETIFLVGDATNENGYNYDGLGFIIENINVYDYFIGNKITFFRKNICEVNAISNLYFNYNDPDSILLEYKSILLFR